MRFIFELVFFALLVTPFPAQLLTADGNNDNTVKISDPTKAAPRAKSSLVCPPPQSIPFEFFPLPCSSHSDCRLMGRDYRCCGREGKVQRCTKAVRREALAKILKTVDAPITVEFFPRITTDSNTTPRPTTARATTVVTTTTTTTMTTRKPTTTTTTTTTTTPKPTTTTTPKPTTTTPRPTTTPVSTTVVTRTAKSAKIQAATNEKDAAKELICPKDSEIPFQFFYVRCVKKHSECKRSLGQDFLCCGQRCVRGATPPVSEQAHQPILGLIPRECPSEPFGELLFDLQSCETDAECWPRVCCPDKAHRYCRTAMPRLDLVPATRNFNSPLSSMASYLQCSPPPAKGLDLFPRACTTSLDCFPNLCCQEDGSRYCRPAKKSLIALLAGLGQRVGSSFVGFAQNELVRENNKLNSNN